MRLLIVEDNPHLGQQIHDLLADSGYAVDLACDGREGLFMGTQYAYDGAIIDLGLPGINGIDLIRKLRRDNHHFPILILTARDHWQDKVTGLEAGADDYLVKPFHHQELSARLNALLRRAAGMSTPVLTAGPIQLNTASKQVTAYGNPVTLTAYEYQLLEYLMVHRDEVISKTRLTEHIYEQDFDRDSNVIEVFVGRLRKKLDPHGTLKPIVTVRGQGYRFALPGE